MTKCLYYMTHGNDTIALQLSGFRAERATVDAIARIERALGVAIENTLASAVTQVEGPGCPPRLSAAVRHAIFAGGQRIRPRLCLAVACACGEDQPGNSDAAAAAIELLHCASLVHDDLPCFDDAATRRGKPSVHAAFGEQLAVLAGDALIVLAFQTLARGLAAAPDRLAPILAIVSGAVGMPGGIVAGQAWESEARVALTDYQKAKTGALFAAASMAGAASTGADPAAWRKLGECLGEAYQVADDIRDVCGDALSLGKPVGQDLAHHRPSAALELGVERATHRLRLLVDSALDSIPACSGAAGLRALIEQQALRFLPPQAGQRAA
jgi:geranylgeranyl diphosphate synthase type II